MALAGGVNAILVPAFLIGFSKAQMMAPDGRCKTFDASADGFVRGEGCGVVVLKRLADALADGDDIWAVIRGIASNQDGRSSGLTAPNGLAQEAVLRAALADAGVAARQVGYVETHGTGTSLGDPIEVQALGAVLGEGRAGGPPVLLGSVKTNLGHLEAAAGVAGLIKAALALRHGEIPPSLHYREPNPYIPWSELAVAVAAERTPYPAIAGRRLAGVSSFGFTGTNVHVVLEAPPEPAAPAADPATPERPLHLMKLSARDGAALDAMIGRWSAFLADCPHRFTDVAFTANTGRADLPERLAVIAADAADARAKLEAHAGGAMVPEVLRARAAAPAGEVAFLFSGHGSQQVGMARRLYDSEPAFRAAIDACDALLRSHLDRPLLSVLYPAEGDDASGALLLDGMTYAQPALFAIEYALARLWRSWGIEPAAVLGHSVGEYAAACIAGVFGLEDGLKLVAARGRLMDSLPEQGAMMAIFQRQPEVEALLAPHRGRACIAALNHETEVVVSGEAAAIEAIAAGLAARGAEFRRLAVAQAAHSHLLDPILDAFETVAATVRFSPPQIGLVSCTTGRFVTPAEIADPRYWRRHLRDTVRFGTALHTLDGEGYRTFLEIGPHAALAGMGQMCIPDGGALWLASLRRDRDDYQQMLESLAALYVGGVQVDWASFERDHLDAGTPKRRISVPTYPWQHRRFWLEHASPSGRRSVPTLPSDAAWAELVDAGRRQEASGPLDLALPSFPDRWRALSTLTTAMIATTLRALGMRSGSEPIEELGILPRYRRLVARWLERLEASGLLDQPGGLAAADIRSAWRDAEQAMPDWTHLLDYLRRCEALLPAVLTGREAPLETIFPKGSAAEADRLYRDFVLPRYFNPLAGAILSAFAATRPGAPLRLLEVGGSTGGMTDTLLPTVERSGGTYDFTDITDLFLARAAERFGDRACVRFGLLDIDRDPLAQGYAAGSFDIVAAANVLHAASDIPATLARMRSLLAPGGLLLLVEFTSYLDWFDVSIALLESWDREDPLRPEHPLLAADTWRQALQDAGFVEAAAFPGPGSPAEIMGQHVLVAQAPLDAAGVADLAATPDAAVRRSPAERAAEAFAARLRASSPREREDQLVDFVRHEIAALLRLDTPRRIERRSRLMETGVDSLMAVELRSRLGTGLALPEPLPATLIFDYPTVEAIVAMLARRLVPEPAANGDGMWQDAMPTESEVDAVDLDVLSDEEVEARLLSRLESIEGYAP